MQNCVCSPQETHPDVSVTEASMSELGVTALSFLPTFSSLGAAASTADSITPTAFYELPKVGLRPNLKTSLLDSAGSPAFDNRIRPRRPKDPDIHNDLVRRPFSPIPAGFSSPRGLEFLNLKPIELGFPKPSAKVKTSFTTVEDDPED